MTHRTVGSVIPVAVRHVSPKSLLPQGEAGGKHGRARLASETRAGDGPASDSRARAGDGPASGSRARAGGAQQTIHERATAWQATAEAAGQATAQ